jgi:predicted MPP superfamily phosphohydrolase
MRINYISDLHLEFAPLELPGGDVLILAGDAAEAIHMDASKIYKYRRNVVPFFYRQLEKYEKVVYVPGNHEYYNGNIQTTLGHIQDFLSCTDVTLLNNDSLWIEGVQFLGSTLWTDIPEPSQYIVEKSMNDFRLIKNGEKRLTPADTVGLHKQALEYLHSKIQDQPTVVITHHAPSFMSITEKYKGSLINVAYATNLENFILDHPTISHWVHGHVHSPHDYMIGSTRILANPRGYVGYEKTDFDPTKGFDI